VANGIHCLALDQQEQALITDLKVVNLSQVARFDVPHDDGAAAYNENIVSGDSGNPAFAIIGDELVLLTTWTGGGKQPYGSQTWAFLDEINAAMTTLGGGYQL